MYTLKVNFEALSTYILLMEYIEGKILLNILGFSTLNVQKTLKF